MNMDMKKIIVFVMILFVSGCANWDEVGHRDRDRHDKDHRPQENSQNDDHGRDHGGR